MKIELIIKNEEETVKLAKIISEYCFGGFLITLNGELGAGKTIFSKAIGEFPILDTSLAEQNAIVDYLDKKCADIDSAIKLLNDYVEQLKVYKTALISEAVTGQIDVRDWQEKSSSNSN